MKKKIVMCFGTFDLLHLGHLNYFQQARQFGNYLVVVVARDKTKWREKKKTVFSEEERVEMVEQIKIVDEATLGYFGDHFRIILEKRPEVICLGYDQQVLIRDLTRELMKRGVVARIVRLRPYKSKTQKSSLLKHKIGLVLQK